MRVNSGIMIIPVEIEGYLVNCYYHPWDFTWLACFDNNWLNYRFFDGDSL